MKAYQWIELLKTLDPNTEVGPWIKSYGHHIIPTLSFDEAGKAVRLVLPILGAPYSTANQDSSGHPFNFRALLWKTGGRAPETMVRVCSELDKAKLAFKITESGWFHIHIPYSAYYSAFTTSDDPAEWRRRQANQEAAAARREAKKAEEKAEKKRQDDLRWAQYQAENEEKERQKKLAQEKAEREAKEEAERRKKEAEALRERIWLAQENPTRSVEVKGGD